MVGTVGHGTACTVLMKEGGPRSRTARPYCAAQGHGYITALAARNAASSLQQTGVLPVHKRHAILFQPVFIDQAQASRPCTHVHTHARALHAYTPCRLHACTRIHAARTQARTYATRKYRRPEPMRTALLALARQATNAYRQAQETDTQTHT
jgi:hypothetical protein